MFKSWKFKLIEILHLPVLLFENLDGRWQKAVSIIIEPSQYDYKFVEDLYMYSYTFVIIKLGLISLSFILRNNESGLIHVVTIMSLLVRSLYQLTEKKSQV